jgi:hypothetical protein
MSKKLSKPEILEAHLRENPDKKDIDIAKAIKEAYPQLFKTSKIDSVRKRIGELRLELNLPQGAEKKQLTVQESIEEDRRIKSLQDKNADYKIKYEHLLKQVDKKDRIIDLHTELSKIVSVSPIRVNKSISKSQATVLTALSDVHIEQRIDKASVNGLNEYNPDIAKIRINNYFINLVKLIKKERQDVVISNLVLSLLGDIIHGYIHEEYQQTNYMTPIQASLYAYELLLQGINYILENDDKLEHITVVCKVGNHSRTTEKSYTDAEALMSHEYGIYKHLAKHFENEKRINFIIEESYLTYLDIYDKTIRFHHGHAFRYGGGVGGLYIPLLKYVSRLQEQRHADIDFIGHWHTHIHIPQALVNGCVCGFSAYSSKLGFKPEAPTQQFQLVDSQRGFTLNLPILLESN